MIQLIQTILLYLLPLIHAFIIDDIPKPTNLTSMSGSYITIDDEKNIWIAGAAGIKTYNIESKKWTNYTTAEGLPKIYGTTVYPTEDKIWFGTELGAAVLDRKLKIITNIVLQSNNSSEYPPTVYSFLTDGDQTYIGTSEGLFRVNNNSLETELYLSKEDGLGDNYIFGLLNDGEYIWAATGYGGGFISLPPITGGLSRIDKESGNVVNYSYTADISNSNLYSLVQVGDSIWTESIGRLWLFNIITESYESILDSDYGSYSQIKLFEDKIWFLVRTQEYEEFLVQMDPKSNSIINQIPADDVIDYFIHDSIIYLLYEESLKFRAINSDQLTTINSPFLPERYSFTTASENDRVYIGSSNYLTKVDMKLNSIESINYDDLIRDIQIDNDIIWLAGNHGLESVTADSMKILKNYLPEHRVLFINVDNNFIWASTTSGFIKVNKSTGEIKSGNYQSELNSFGNPEITGIVVDDDFAWVSFSSQKEGGYSTGIIKADKNSLNLLNISKYHLNSPANKISDIVSFGDKLICAGDKIRIFNKDSLLFKEVIEFNAEKLKIKNDILFASTGKIALDEDDHIIKAFNISTSEEIFGLNESSGLLNDYVNDMYVNDDYLWVSTYGGISGFNISSITDIETEDEHGGYIITEFYLEQNYPNPFNPVTTIKYTIPQLSIDGVKSKKLALSSAEVSKVKMVVYDILGREVVTLVNEEQNKGNYEVQFDGSNISSGIYYYQLHAGEYVETKKMILMK